jgi:hypothetical protein
MGRVEPEISNILVHYETDILIAQLTGQPKLQKRQIAKLIKALVVAAEVMIDLPAEYAVAIEALANDNRKSPTTDFIRLQDDIIALAVGAERFLTAFNPPKGRPTNAPLESAIRDLVKLFNGQHELPITIKWNKLKDVGPQPDSKAARAIVAIMQSGPCAPTDVAILNMIQKVIDDPDGEAPSPFDPVLLTHFDELDASLLPDRQKWNQSSSV